MLTLPISTWWLASLACGVLLVAMAAAAEETAAGGGDQPVETIPANHMLVSREASERGTAGIDNKIVTLGQRTHVVWQDSTEQGYFSRVRTLDRTTGKWGLTVTLGQGVDNHARPCLSADSQGYLHVIIGGHNTPLQYLRSEKPNDSSAWTPPQVFGRGTYPMLVCAPDDTLVVSIRPSGSGAKPSGIDLYIKAPDETGWTRRPLVMEKEARYAGYVGYNAALAWGPGGRLHFACDVYEGPGVYKQRGVHQAVVYMYSDDLGETWRRSDDSLIEGPPHPQNLDVISRSLREREQDMPTPMLRIAGLVVDSRGRPYVLYTQHEPNPGTAHLVTPDGKSGWRQLPLAEALARTYPDLGALGARGAFSIGNDDTLQFLLPMAIKADMGTPGDMKVPDEKVRYVWVEATDGDGSTFRFREPIPSEPVAPRHTPTVEHPTGHHGVSADRAAGVMYIEGLHRYPKRGEVIQNRLYFVDPAKAP